MDDEDQKQPEEQSRQLKIKGGEINKKGEGKEGKEPKEKESGSKLWVLLVLVITVILSLIFSFKNGGVKRQEQKTPFTNVEMEVPKEEKEGGFFGPAVYEYER